jgi:amino acid transporter
VAGIAASRLIWAVARDGVLPFSGWISTVSEKQQPRNAIIVMHAVAALLLCTILASPVAFSSLVSAAGVPTITAYALICCEFTSSLLYFRTNILQLGAASSHQTSSRMPNGLSDAGHGH